MAKADLQQMFGSEGSQEYVYDYAQEYVYDYAHIHPGLGGALPKQWVAVTNTQVHRLVYMLLHNLVAPHIFCQTWEGGC